MLPTVRAGTQPTTPFMTMFWLMFGETLAGFLGVLVVLFFGFHIYLMSKAAILGFSQYEQTGVLTVDRSKLTSC
eukprot:g24658.t1